MDKIARLKEFLQANPADSFVQHALSLEYIKAGDERSARTLLEQLLQRDPGYVGSYYHLARLCERMNDREAAIHWYEQGMARAKAAGDQHAYGELRSALEELTF